MRRFNLSDPNFTYDPADPDGYRAGLFRMGPDAGAEDTGTSLYELPPGEALCPYHYEHGEEECDGIVSKAPLAGAGQRITLERADRRNHRIVAHRPVRKHSDLSVDATRPDVSADRMCALLGEQLRL